MRAVLLPFIISLVIGAVSAVHPALIWSTNDVLHGHRMGTEEVSGKSLVSEVLNAEGVVLFFVAPGLTEDDVVSAARCGDLQSIKGYMENSESSLEARFTSHRPFGEIVRTTAEEKGREAIFLSLPDSSCKFSLSVEILDASDVSKREEEVIVVCLPSFVSSSSSCSNSFEKYVQFIDDFVLREGSTKSYTLFLTGDKEYLHQETTSESFSSDIFFAGSEKSSANSLEFSSDSPQISSSVVPDFSSSVKPSSSSGVPSSSISIFSSSFEDSSSVSSSSSSSNSTDDDDNNNTIWTTGFLAGGSISILLLFVLGFGFSFLFSLQTQPEIDLPKMKTQ